jgi:hypothetical protein
VIRRSYCKTLREQWGDKAHEVRERLTDALEIAKRTCRKVEEKTIEGARTTDKTIR